jgi:hypothetical protein
MTACDLNASRVSYGIRRQGVKECSPEASQSISRVSAADLLSFTQNLMQACCSILQPIADKTRQEVGKALV